MIPPVMNRPMFNQAQPQLQAPQMSMNPQAQAQVQMAEKQASAQALAGMAQGIEDLNQELDNAENYTGVMDALRGNTASVKERRGELAQLVGDKDANKTPESVLTLVQPTMMFLEVAENAQQNPQQNAPGGISNLPVQPSGAQQTMPSGGGGITNFFAGVRSPGTQEAVARMEQGEQPVKRFDGSPQQGEIIYSPLLQPPQYQTLTPAMVQQNIPAAQSLLTAPAKPPGFEDYFGTMQSSIGSFIPQARTTDDILKQYRSVLGDPTKDLAKSSFYGGLTKFGAQLAQKPGGILAGGSEALLDVAPGISEDFTKVTQAKIKQDQATKLAALQQSQAEKKAFDQNMFTFANSAFADWSRKNTQYISDLNKFRNDSTNLAVTFAQGNVKEANQALDAAYISQRQFAGKDSKLFVAKDTVGNPSKQPDLITVRYDANSGEIITAKKDGTGFERVDTNKYIPVREAGVQLSKFKGDQKLLSGTKLNRQTGMPMPVQYYIDGSGIAMLQEIGVDGEVTYRAQTQSDYFNPEKFGDVVKITPSGQANFYTYNLPDGTTMDYSVPKQIPQEMLLEDGSTERVVKDGKFVMVNALSPDVIMKQIKDSSGKVIGTEPLFPDVITADSPFARLVPATRLGVLDDKTVRSKQSQLNSIEQYLRAVEQLLSEGLENTNVGFLATTQNFLNNNLGGILPDQLEFTREKQARIDKLAKIVTRKETIAAIEGDRKSVQEQKLLLESLVGDSRSLMQSPRTKIAELQEYTREVVNLKNQLIAELRNDGGYIVMDPVPSGRKGDEFDGSNKDTYDYLANALTQPEFLKLAKENELFIKIPINQFILKSRNNIQKLTDEGAPQTEIDKEQAKLNGYISLFEGGQEFINMNIRNAIRGGP